MRKFLCNDIFDLTLMYFPTFIVFSHLIYTYIFSQLCIIIFLFSHTHTCIMLFSQVWFLSFSLLFFDLTSLSHFNTSACNCALTYFPISGLMTSINLYILFLKGKSKRYVRNKQKSPHIEAVKGMFRFGLKYQRIIIKTFVATLST